MATITARDFIEVVEVTREQIAAHGGRDWNALRAEAESDDCPLVLRRVEYWGVNQRQLDDPKWNPMRTKEGEELPYLPLNSAWLREHQGRAFLYLQNW